MPLSRNHTSAPAQTYFRVCPDILPGLGRHSINYGAVFINYGAVCKNYGVVLRIRKQRKKYRQARAEVWVGRRGSLDAGKGEGEDVPKGGGMP